MSISRGGNGSGGSGGLFNLPLSSNITHRLRIDSVQQQQKKQSINSKNNFITSYLTSSSPRICKPSDLRRSRIVNGGFSFVTPLSDNFPYQVINRSSPSSPPTLTSIEDYLASLEPDLDQTDLQLSRNPKVGDQQQQPQAREALLYPIGITSQARSNHYEQKVRPNLLHLSKSALKECFPSIFEHYYDKDDNLIHDEGRIKELVRVLSGEVVLVRPPEEAYDGDGFGEENEDNMLIRSKGFAPWSLAYAGHQFGFFAGQLGDGRAISILSTPSANSVIQKAFNLPTENEDNSKVSLKPKIEIQLKGAGRTPYSRFADGLAVLRSSIREYLGSESCSKLHEFPTSRSLSLVSTDGIIVERESFESGAIVSRLSPLSWVRIGSFEDLRWKKDWVGLDELVEYVCTNVYNFQRENNQSENEGGLVRSLKMVEQVMIRNAKMVAAWQAWGFMHGVINTDNISIVGVTIDYGPYAFMDVFDQDHICNHSDELGRYSYKNQPEMIKFGIKKLGESLAELIGLETERSKNKKIPSSPTTPLRNGIDEKSFEEVMNLQDDNEQAVKFKETIKKIGIIEFEEKVLNRFDKIYEGSYHALMRRRLGLKLNEDTDFELIIEPLLNLMGRFDLDYSITMRSLNLLIPKLSPTKSSSEANSDASNPAEDGDVTNGSEEFFAELNRKHYDYKKSLIFKSEPSKSTKDAEEEGEGYGKDRSKKVWIDWIKTYSDRILKEFEQRDGERRFEDFKVDFREKILKNNPRFVLRQWILERLIKILKAEKEDQALKGLNGSRFPDDYPKNVEEDEISNGVDRFLKVEEGESKGLKEFNRVYELLIDPFDLDRVNNGTNLTNDGRNVENFGKSNGDGLNNVNRSKIFEDEEDEERFKEFYSGLGDFKFLGFQCSCSS